MSIGVFRSLMLDVHHKFIGFSVRLRKNRSLVFLSSYPWKTILTTCPYCNKNVHTLDFENDPR